MHRSAVRWLLAIGLGFASASPALAQFGVANLSHTEGVVTIDGAQIGTASGRAEVTFLDGAIVHVDRDTRIVLTGSGFRLLHGRASLRSSGYKEYVAETAAAKVLVPAGSTVEITVRTGTDVLLQVISGVARIETPSGSLRVPDYHTAYVPGPARAATVARVASTQADDFGRWTLARTVMMTSTALKGSEEVGGINHGPVYYPSYSNSFYQTPSYGSSYYGSSYYGSSYYGSYYATPYYTTPYYGSYYSYYSNPYYASPYAYYNPYSYRYSHSYPSYRSPFQGRRGYDSPRPVHPIARHTPARGMTRGAVAVVPRR